MQINLQLLKNDLLYPIKDKKKKPKPKPKPKYKIKRQRIRRQNEFHAPHNKNRLQDENNMRAIEKVEFDPKREKVFKLLS